MSDYKSAVERFGSSLNLRDRQNVKSKCCQRFGNQASSAPLLTIGIPVYNGFSSINRTLTSVYNALQTIKNIDDVEIFISDNASTDLTSEAIENFFVGKNARGAHFRNDENVGFDVNLDLIVRLGAGKYIWFLGCGDEIKEDSVKRLIDKLNQYNSSNLMLDFDRFSEADNVLIQNREYLIAADKVVIGQNNFNHSRYAPALSGNVVKRQSWLNCVSEKFTASGWRHVERILKIISSDIRSETVILPEPFFTLYIDQKGWWTKPDGYKLHLEHIKVIKSMALMKFEKKSVNLNFLKMNGIVLIRSIVGSKKYGYVFSKEDLKEIQIYTSFTTFLLIKFALLIPLRLASFIFSENKSKAIWLGLRKINNKLRELS